MTDQNLRPAFKDARLLLLDRRTSVRFPCNLSAICQRGGGKTGIGLPATVRDVSQEGMGLVISRPFSRDRVLTVKLQAAEGSIRRTAQVVVKYVRQEPGGWFHGCVFLTRLSEGELQALLQ